MKFVLFRHAHKGLLPFEDPELSIRGFDQAMHLLNLIKDNALPPPTSLLISPKKRTAQTFYPIAKVYAISMKIVNELDQRQNEETSSHFRLRVQSFLDSIESNSPNETIYACTHFDFIEEAMSLINCNIDLNTFEFSHWAPTQFALFEINNGDWTFLKKGAAI